MTLREIMTKRIRNDGWLDYDYRHKREDLSYETWLSNLSDEDFLDAYNRVKEAESHLYDSDD